MRSKYNCILQHSLLTSQYVGSRRWSVRVVRCPATQSTVSEDENTSISISPFTVIVARSPAPLLLLAGVSSCLRPLQSLQCKSNIGPVETSNSQTTYLTSCPHLLYRMKSHSVVWCFPVVVPTPCRHVL